MVMPNRPAPTQCARCGHDSFTHASEQAGREGIDDWYCDRCDKPAHHGFGDSRPVEHPDPWMDNEPGALTLPEHWGGHVPLPPQTTILGPVTASWEQIDPGVALIKTQGGTEDDRALVHDLLRVQLAHHGYEHAQFHVGDDLDLRKTGHWRDLMAKARRLIDSGQVQILRNSRSVVAAHVIGDHGEYNCDFSRDDPNSWSITGWHCECPWSQYAWQRTRQWKKYEGRVCSHVLAAFWYARRHPMDEDGTPGPDGPQRGMKGWSPSPAPGGAEPEPAFAGPGEAPGAQAGPGEQQQMFGPEQDPGQFTQMTQPKPDAMPGTMPGGPTMPNQEPMQPPGPDIIPQQPMLPGMLPPYVPGSTPNGLPAPPNAFSVPGARPANPMNPGQYPGGTLSKVDGRVYNRGDGEAPHTSGSDRAVLASDPADQQAAGPSPYFPSAGEVTDANRAVHAQAGQPERFTLHSPGFVEGAVQRAQAVYAQAPSHPEGIVSAAAHLAHGIAQTQPFRDGNRRTARAVTQAFLANNGMGHVSPLGLEDQHLARYLNGTVEGGTHPVEQYADLFRRRAMNRRRVGAQAQFENGMKVKLLSSEWGIAEGKSEAHGSGQYREVHQGTLGEVLGQDATTGWVEVIFPCDTSGPMEPYHVRSFVEPKSLKIMGTPPGSPFIQRVGPHT